MASTLASTYAPVETRPAVQVASKTLSKHGKFSTTNVFKLAGTAAAAPVDGVVTVVKSIEARFVQDGQIKARATAVI